MDKVQQGKGIPRLVEPKSGKQRGGGFEEGGHETLHPVCPEYLDESVDVRRPGVPQDARGAIGEPFS